MALIKPDPTPKRLQIDLSGTEGNAFVLLGYAKRLAQELGYDEEDAKRICKEMKASDYEHLVVTFDRYFGQIVDLILPPNWTWKEHESRVSAEEAASLALVDVVLPAPSTPKMK